MTNDRELLELAAKAAELTRWEYTESDEGLFVEVFDLVTLWNPLESDGDALRLAVKLGLLIKYIPERYDLFVQFYCEELNNDLKPSEATRRAIVRAAAEIGRTL